MISVKLLELGIQFLVLGVNRTYLAQFSIAKGIGHDFASQSDNQYGKIPELLDSTSNTSLAKIPALDSDFSSRVITYIPTRMYETFILHLRQLGYPP